LRIDCDALYIDRMSEPSKSRPPGPPHNPDVRQLVEEKRRWSSSLNMENAKRGFRGWHERGYLPHRDEPGLTQFVTFRLADSFPESLRSEWEHFLKLEDDREQRKQLEAYLDKGHANVICANLKSRSCWKLTFGIFPISAGHRPALQTLRDTSCVPG
jgi:hypothetical protein